MTNSNLVDCTTVPLPPNEPPKAAAEEECVGCDEDGIDALARKGSEGRIDLVARTGVEDMDLQPDDAGGFLRVPQCGLGVRSIGRIDEHGNT
jgi:hypothetical protein